MILRLVPNDCESGAAFYLALRLPSRLGDAPDFPRVPFPESIALHESADGLRWRRAADNQSPEELCPFEILLCGFL